ncbi:MAG: TadE/TadG family type IV pilus assembly protein [Pirellulaceae bacterium]
MWRNRNGRAGRKKRLGAVSVEMALVAPIFVAVIAGLAETGRLLDAQTQLATAARLGARLATMDRSGLLAENQTTNDKISQEIRTYLNANGLSGDAADVFVVDPTDHATPFDLDDPDNDLALFELRVEFPYSELSGTASDTWTMTAKVVFRNARSALVQ